MKRQQEKKIQTGTDSHTLLLLTGDDFVDHSIYSHTVTNSGVTLSGEVSRFGSSYRFGGSAKINVDIGDKRITNGVFTLEMWIKLNDVVKSYKCVADFCNHSTMYFDASDNRDGTLVLMNGAASWQAYGSAMYNGSVVLSTDWNHVAIVGNDSGHNWLYLNGTKLTSGNYSSSTNVMSMANGKIQFGNIALNMSRYFKGYMEEIRLSNIVRYTDNFIPQSLR
jgi:hypothetical protein